MLSALSFLQQAQRAQSLGPHPLLGRMTPNCALLHRKHEAAWPVASGRRASSWRLGHLPYASARMMVLEKSASRRHVSCLPKAHESTHVLLRLPPRHQLLASDASDSEPVCTPNAAVARGAVHTMLRQSFRVHGRDVWVNLTVNKDGRSEMNSLGKLHIVLLLKELGA